MSLITERTGDMFESNAEVYGHGVNIAGVMGAGIARQFKANYPSMYEEYKNFCDNNELKPGETFMYEVSTIHWIANIVSQDMPGANARYGWLTMGLAATYGDLVDRGHQDWTVALPQIGCGIGGLDWNIVRGIIVDVAEFYDIKTELWTYGN
jgi:O-acetyl-ADP-ribose deacetylase (regulator of RNase III)